MLRSYGISLIKDERVRGCYVWFRKFLYRHEDDICAELEDINGSHFIFLVGYADNISSYVSKYFIKKRHFYLPQRSISLGDNRLIHHTSIEIYRILLLK